VPHPSAGWFWGAVSLSHFGITARDWKRSNYRHQRKYIVAYLN
jgi:hypothetical protein